MFCGFVYSQCGLGEGLETPHHLEVAHRIAVPSKEYMHSVIINPTTGLCYITIQ